MCRTTRAGDKKPCFCDLFMGRKERNGPCGMCHAAMGQYLFYGSEKCSKIRLTFERKILSSLFFFQIHWTRCSGYRVFKGEWIKCTQRCESIFIINTMVAEVQNIHSCPWILIRKCGWMRWSLLADGEHRNFECTIQIYHAYRISIR